MSALAPLRRQSRFEQLRELGSDLLIVAAFIYAVPLVVGLGVLLVRFLTA